MPKELGGYSDLGRQINSINSGTDFVKSRVTPDPKIGLIKSVLPINGNDQYQVILTMVDKVTGKPYDSEPILLIDHPEFLGSTFGSPKDLEGKYYCAITYIGPTFSRGTARIIRSLNDEMDQAAKWNELDQQGSAFAAPGSGF